MTSVSGWLSCDLAWRWHETSVGKSVKSSRLHRDIPTVWSTHAIRSRLETEWCVQRVSNESALLGSTQWVSGQKTKRSLMVAAGPIRLRTCGNFWPFLDLFFGALRRGTASWRDRYATDARRE